MTYLGKLTFATTALLLISGGIWANLAKTTLPQMRGVWVTQGHARHGILKPRNALSE